MNIKAFSVVTLFQFFAYIASTQTNQVSPVERLITTDLSVIVNASHALRLSAVDYTCDSYEYYQGFVIENTGSSSEIVRFELDHGWVCVFEFAGVQNNIEWTKYGSALMPPVSEIGRMYSIIRWRVADTARLIDGLGESIETTACD